MKKTTVAYGLLGALTLLACTPLPEPAPRDDAALSVEDSAVQSPDEVMPPEPDAGTEASAPQSPAPGASEAGVSDDVMDAAAPQDASSPEPAQDSAIALDGWVADAHAGDPAIDDAASDGAPAQAPGTKEGGELCEDEPSSCISGVCRGGFCCDQPCPICTTCGFELDKGNCTISDDDAPGCEGNLACARGSCAIVAAQTLPSRLVYDFRAVAKDDRIGQIVTIQSGWQVLQFRFGISCPAENIEAVHLESVGEDGRPTGDFVRTVPILYIPKAYVKAYGTEPMWIATVDLARHHAVVGDRVGFAVSVKPGKTCRVAVSDNSSYAGGWSYWFIDGSYKVRAPEDLAFQIVLER